MKTQTIKHRLLAGSVLLLSVALTACNSDDNDSSDTTLSDTTLSGTAAVGAAVQMGTVTAKCQGGATFTQTVKTDNNGKWRGFVKKEALPCALQVTGGTPSVTLHSYATTGGIVNITPLTDLMIAEQTGLSPSAWFAAFDASVAIDINDTTLTEALNNAGYSVPAGNPFTTGFNANGEGWDGLLDDLQEAIEDDATLTSYQDLMTQIRDGNLASSLPEPPENTEEPEEPTDPELPSNLNVLTAFAGTYTVSGTATEPVNRGTATRGHARGTITISANGDVDFDTGISFTGTDINAIYDRRNICDFEPQFDRTACRVHVNYDADDSGRKLEIFLDLDKTTVLEIRYQDGQGGRTRALIGSAGDDEEPVTPVNEAKARLSGQDGITGLVDGVEYTYTENGQLGSLSGRKLLSYYDGSTDYLWQLHLPQEPGTYSCAYSLDAAHILLMAGEDFEHQVTPALGGSCTLELMSVTGVIEGSFEGQMYNGSEIITSGYFIHSLD